MTPMAMEGASDRRLRINFEDRTVLSKTQKKLGLKRSWLLLKPEHHTINDVVSHILDAFDLRLTCPNGIVLTMDGFVLPPFESTIILNDKDLISVKRKASCLKAIEESRPFLENGIVEKLPLTSGVKLLTNEEFDKENGGEVEVEELAQSGVVALKKRKASSPIESSKKKRLRQVMSKNVQKDINHCENIKTPKKKRKLGGSNGEIIAKCTNNSELKSNELVETHEVNTHAFVVWEGTKKVSRSTRRKSIKRRLKRVGGSKTGNNKGQDKKEDPILKLDKVSGFERSADSKIREVIEEDSDEDEDLVPVEIRPGHIVFTPASKVKDVQNRQEGNGGVVQKTQETNGWDVQQTQKGALVDHSAQNTGYDANKNKIVKETCCWNGITNKRKGQKWGKENPSSSWKDSRDYNGSSSNARVVKNQPRDQNSQTCNTLGSRQTRPKDVALDFEKLMPLTDSPKVGDIIAYRLLELSSSWCPELSSFRVGKITSYDQETNNIVLVPEAEYPLNLEKKTGKDNDHDDDDDEPPQPSLYKEDGSLEIDFPSLVEVRVVKSSGPSQTGISKDTNQVKHGSMNGTTLEDTGSKELHTPTTPAKGTKDVWEEITEALNAKKAQLQKEDNWNKKESSTKRSWSHRTLKSSAIGPTMAMLRSQNGGLNNNP